MELRATSSVLLSDLCPATIDLRPPSGSTTERLRVITAQGMNPFNGLSDIH
ncbi:hypothetical protein SESBI_08149 [Sesbania bispinosa]|nr:hypothetical protein SESBI_45170 [Sesbania bispinosa]KAJ1429746.1 hypothetical protein SESBI_08149 [Sesbania bispinosa]